MSTFDDEHGFWRYETRIKPPAPTFKQNRALKKYVDMKTKRPMNDFERDALRTLLAWAYSFVE